MSEPQEAGNITVWAALTGGIVHTPDLAMGISELLIAARYGSDELDSQRPLVVTDQTESWLIEGSRNAGRKAGERGPAKIVMAKRDGRILDFHVPMIVQAHPDVWKYLEEPGREGGSED